MADKEPAHFRAVQAPNGDYRSICGEQGKTLSTTSLASYVTCPKCIRIDTEGPNGDLLEGTDDSPTPMPPSQAAPYGAPMQYEFDCKGCGERFVDNEANATELIEHYQKQDGTPCGSTQTTLAGTWHTAR